MTARARSSRLTHRRTDEGSVLLIVLVTVIVMSLVVVGIVNFADTVTRIQERSDPRLASAQAVDSGMRMAISMARDNGPTGCFTTSSTYRINDLDVDVTCTTQAVYSSGTGRFGVITTTNASNTTNLAGRGSGFKKDISGQVFYNAGNVRGTNSDILVRNNEITYSQYTSANTVAKRYVKGSGGAVACTDAAVSTNDLFASGVSALDGKTYSHTHSCITVPWWERAGDNATGTGWAYPKLPPLPSYSRNGSLATAGTCKVYYPGRYTGATALILDGGTHYFASGVYYFERNLDIRNGAKVVMGDGRIAGCSYDAEAAVLPTAPRAHEITGRGATILLGSGAKFIVSSSSVEINRRVSTVSTEGSAGVSIRTVNFGTATNAIQVPADVVALSDGTTQPVANHSIQLTATSPVLKYTTSSLGTNAFAVDVTLNGSSTTTNRFVTDGYVFVPNSAVRVVSTVKTYRLQMSGGIVSSALTLNLSQAPTVGTDWLVGVVNNAIQRKMVLTSAATEDGVTRRATAVVEVHQDRSFAVNSWSTS